MDIINILKTFIRMKPLTDKRTNVFIYNVTLIEELANCYKHYFSFKRNFPLLTFLVLHIQ